MTQIITHRGLNPSKKNYYAESSLEAFKDQAKRGFGLEFDISLTKDGQIVIFHDAGLERITGGADKRLIQELNLEEFKKVRIQRNRLCEFNELMEIIRGNKAPINALHLKGKYQTVPCLDILMRNLQGHREFLGKLMIFDLKITAAQYLKNKIPELILAPSAAHPHDIKRYNGAAGGTLVTVEETIKNRQLFDWVWLDEWDLADKDGGSKTLYNKETFDRFRAAGIKVGLVTPELHGTSPSLLGGETHPDAVNKNILLKRVKEIIKLKPDAICTDYPDETKKILLNMQEI